MLVGALIMLDQHKQIGGEAVHIRDCYVWAEISYLDSSTDYREFLPQLPANPGTVSRDELVMLDTDWSLSNARGTLAIAGQFLVVSGVILCLLFYWMG